MGDVLLADPTMVTFLTSVGHYVNDQDFKGDGPAISEFMDNLTALGGKVIAKVTAVQLTNGANQSVPLHEKIACPSGYAPAEAELDSIDYSVTNGVVTKVEANWATICS